MKFMIYIGIILILIFAADKDSYAKKIHHKRNDLVKSIKRFNPARVFSKSKRGSHGHIKRSEEAKHEFWRLSGYPHGRKGYVVDHIIPLACGGADEPSNMQWQTIAKAKSKDKWERKGCGKQSNTSNKPH